MVQKPSARHAYVAAETSTALAHQIRAIRTQRGWTQRDLAVRLGTTQAAVSRLEDPSYGRLSVQTLIELARVFDTGLQVKFVSLIEMLKTTWQPSAADRWVKSFDEEAPVVLFHSGTALPEPPVVGFHQLPSGATTAIEASTVLHRIVFNATGSVKSSQPYQNFEQKSHA